MSHIKVSCAILHNPQIEERRIALGSMLAQLHDEENLQLNALRVFDDVRPSEMNWHHFKVGLFSKQWRWAYEQGHLYGTTHHLFMTDDLHLAPNFAARLVELIAQIPNGVIGLLSNHPLAETLYRAGYNWYRSNSWVVGPAYVVPHDILGLFLDWYQRLPHTSPDVEGSIYWYNDDTALNRWIACEPDGPREAWHPLPTIIEHRGDLGSTCGHGDVTSRERVSWRAVQTPVVEPVTWKIDWLRSPLPLAMPIQNNAPMLRIGQTSFP